MQSFDLLIDFGDSWIIFISICYCLSVVGTWRNRNFGLCKDQPTVHLLTNYTITYAYWTVHHLDTWIKLGQLDVTYFNNVNLLLNMFRMLIHPSSGACDYLVCYCVGCIVLAWGVLVLCSRFTVGDAVSECSLNHYTNSKSAT